MGVGHAYRKGDRVFIQVKLLERPHNISIWEFETTILGQTQTVHTKLDQRHGFCASSQPQSLDSSYKHGLRAKASCSCSRQKR